MPDDVPDRTLDLPESDAVAPSVTAVPGTIGHFRIARELGAGGMGIVYEAWDLDLDRRVAIKVVRDRQAGSAAGRRLVEEAQAMARLAHPNVVAVHEVGTVADQVFVVMELVPGVTLAEWLATPRTWREIVRAFAEAGDGLVAAHEAGLVHGDFKPSNVLVDPATNRVRVADFGLARLEEREHGKLAAGSKPAGTPGYMAPEIVAGEAYDGRADQYAFAVALRQALQDRGAPRRIRRALDRALSPDPAARFPAMRELVRELRGALRTRRRAVLAIGGVAAASAAIAGGLVWSTAPARGEHGLDCLAGASLVDSVWTADARDRTARGGATAAKLVDSWAGAWRLARRSACTAEPTERPARLACLDQRLGDLRAQLAVWEAGDREVTSQVLRAASALPSPDACAVRPVPARATSSAIVERGAHVAALQRAGRSAEAEPLLDTLVVDATATGDPATLAGVEYTAALVERDVVKLVPAGAHAAAAARAAATAGDDARLVDAMILQAAIAVDRGQAREAVGLLDAASAIGARSQIDRAAALAQARGDALTQAGRIPEAIGELQRAVSLLEAAAQRDPAVRVRFAAALGSLAAAEGLRYHFEDARALLERCLAIEEADYGPAHPEVAKTLHDLANNEARLRQFDEGRKHYERARAIVVAAYGANHHMVAMTDYSMAGLELQADQPDAARPLLERALAELAASVGPEHPDVAHVEGALGALERDKDRCREGLPHLERALAILHKDGRGGVQVISVLTNLGACLSDVGRDAEARPILERALSELSSIQASELERSEQRALLAEVEWRAQHRERAIELARQVVTATDGAAPPYDVLHGYMKDELATWLRRK
ncbi:MAG TPA: serine/threonine-protein kinase [Kofleriaceae bacterium]|nr:serine/threonine-protein kinase [Kofleriaceae bacterium]